MEKASHGESVPRRKRPPTEKASRDAFSEGRSIGTLFVIVKVSHETLKLGGPLVFWVSKLMPKSGKLVFFSTNSFRISKQCLGAKLSMSSSAKI